jgi:hypothetical protein
MRACLLKQLRFNANGWTDATAMCRAPGTAAQTSPSLNVVLGAQPCPLPVPPSVEVPSRMMSQDLKDQIGGSRVGMAVGMTIINGPGALGIPQHWRAPPWLSAGVSLLAPAKNH